MKTIGERLKFLMDNAGIKSQEALGHELGISQGAISKILRNEQKDTTFTIKISKYFGCDPFWFELNEGNPFSKTGRVPFVEWYQIPDICQKPEEIEKLKPITIDINFKEIKNLYATKIPELKIPGISRGFFDPRDHLLINPTKNVTHAMPIIVNNEGSSEPEYGIYWKRGADSFIKYPDEQLMPLTKETHICGVVIARLNIFIKI